MRGGDISKRVGWVAAGAAACVDVPCPCCAVCIVSAQHRPEQGIYISVPATTCAKDGNNTDALMHLKSMRELKTGSTVLGSC
jgi:hypothetical protein